MEANFVHRPAVTPEDEDPARALPPRDRGTPAVESVRTAIEEQMRERPGPFLIGGFVAGVVLGLIARR